MRGFFIAAAVVLLFSLLILSLQQNQQAAQTPSLRISKADELASGIAYDLRPLLPKTSHEAGKLVLSDTMPDASSGARFASYSSLVSEKLSPMVNAKIALDSSPTLLVGDSLSYKYDSYSKNRLEIEQAGSGQASLRITLPESCSGCASGNWSWSGAPFSISVIDSRGKEAFPGASGGFLSPASSNSLLFRLGNGSLLLSSAGGRLIIEPRGVNVSTELSMNESGAVQPIFLESNLNASGQTIDRLRVG